MLSPSAYSLSRQLQPPPVRPSRSLEGLERVIPPSSLPVVHTRSRLHLDKPLPDLPARSRTQSPDHFIGSTAWSDDSSTVNSFEDDDDDDDEDDLRCRRRSSISTESYPVFVRAGSDDPDRAGFVDHPSVSTLDHTDTPSADPYDNHHKPAAASSLPGLTFLANEHYTPPPPPQQQWNNHVGPNHYFREKKWDFFPELATPSALQNSPHNNFTSRPRKKDTARRWIPIPSDKGAAFANDVRNSIRSIQRRLSRNSMDKDKPKRGQTDGRPTTSPIEFARGLYSSSTSSPPPQLQTTLPSTDDYYFNHRVSSIPQTPVYTSVDEKLTRLSISPTGSSISDQSMLARETLSQSLSSIYSHYEKPLPKPKSKQLAVPISPYQKYGAAIWDKSGKEKKPKPKHRKRLSYQHHRQPQRVRFLKYRNRNRRESSQLKGNNNTFVSSTVPLKPPGRKQTRTPLRQGTRYAVRALQDGTSQVLVAIDGAKKRMAGTSPFVSKTSRIKSASTSKLDMRRTHLKSQIRLVGPVNPYTTSHRRDPWI
ncbi:hypothetical protein ASPVEDRAFT_81742 [Aspergillus versicolor CBS 583.65]|uniref:Uncharacterized protein n=1 Tax=Aspergillus versicolor CBS 583.65 TaxID=1036611 RepID=A0A1L9PF80_ASPVE|nr:uncharacterized protein ASPVEDRAFT_81742 [Aspergillus versicolor CBS 583.65]OJJ00160.1 hypothetical protein ASPVEDRAFT_81742 [Aspergillus versicolor CBS 583.65]